MSNTPVQSSQYSEDWSSYRKLVVDTLKRLDDRTLDTFQRLSDLTSRVHVIENNGNTRELSRLEAEIKAVDVRVDDIDNDINEIKTTLAEQTGSKKVILWLIGGVCTVVGFIINVGIEKIWPGAS